MQAAWDRQQPWLDLTSIGFCYFVDFQTMTQINRQTQRQQRIQRRSDMVYPLVSGPLSKTSQARGTGSGSGGIAKGLASGGGSTGALLAVGVSGSTLSRKGSVVYPSGTLSGSSLAPPGQPCACQQCMLVLSVKANGTSSQTLGRATKPNSPKFNFGTLPSSSASMSVLNSYSHTLPQGTSLKCSLSEEAKNSALDQSLSLLTSDTANLSISSSHSPPLTLPSPNQQPSSAPSSSSSSTFVATAMLINTSTIPTSSTDSTALPSQLSAACAAPLPTRASLTGLSRPALQRIAVAQSRALIASG